MGRFMILLQILLACLPWKYVQAFTVVPYEPYAQSTEYKASYETYESEPHPFAFGYEVLDEHGNKQQRQEQGDHNGHVKGSYGYTDAHGIYRHVEYVADHGGFRAIVQSNEPGISNEDPADVQLTAKLPPQQVLEHQYSKLAEYSEPKPTLKLKSGAKPTYRESVYSSSSSIVPVVAYP